ncbi:uncharacterized protein MJAP1_004067 [Malassezia japonica]|uniref:Uncharacterized protein n=1 Tax=Malassezia japonica TaxID=223818 RepID=A0AAF0F6Y7_9BASI|nr:uncharacterized protein MJAP1_004067 [Malassezia japonica]WFD41074.1 hypothetical protein MJAP1_004067 [Malassezia japonica]
MLLSTGYGSLLFRDADGAERMLKAAHQKHGRIRIPYSARPEDNIAYATLHDAERAWKTAPSVRDVVREAAPLASGARGGDQDYFLVKAERQRAPDAPDAQGPRARSAQSLLSRWGGFSGALGEKK